MYIYYHKKSDIVKFECPRMLKNYLFYTSFKNLDLIFKAAVFHTRAKQVVGPGGCEAIYSFTTHLEGRRKQE